MREHPDCQAIRPDTRLVALLAVGYVVTIKPGRLFPHVVGPLGLTLFFAIRPGSGLGKWQHLLGTVVIGRVPRLADRLHRGDCPWRLNRDGWHQGCARVSGREAHLPGQTMVGTYLPALEVAAAHATADSVDRDHESFGGFR